MTDPAELRAEVQRMAALYRLAHPEQTDVSDDTIRRAAAETILSRRRPTVPNPFLAAFEDADDGR